MEEWKSHWKGRVTDPNLGPLYFYQVVKEYDSEQDLIDSDGVLIGYNYDFGVEQNQGRIGASDGPDAIRKSLAACAISHGDLKLYDAGNLFHSKGVSVVDAQLVLSDKVSSVLGNGGIPICMGGGHDMSFGSHLGLRKKYPKLRLGIINFDAHFDLRKPKNDANSGTPFFQAFQLEQPLDYLAVGIQKESNTSDLFRIADQLGVTYVTEEEVHKLSEEKLKSRLDAFIARVDYLHLSIDLDVFSAAFAPGVSAINAMGLYPDQIMPLMKHVLRSEKVKVLDIAEMNPKYDVDRRTAKLAAKIIARIMEEIT